MRANAELLELANNHGITPHRCPRCGTVGASYQAGYDDGRDADYVGYRCGGCGNVTGLGRRQIQRRAKAHW